MKSNNSKLLALLVLGLSGITLFSATNAAYTNVSNSVERTSVKSSSEMKGKKSVKNNNVTLPANAISQAQASQVVLDANPGAKILSVSIGKVNWVVVYKIKLDNKKTVKVDALKWTILTSQKKMKKNTKTTSTKSQ